MNRPTILALLSLTILATPGCLLVADLPPGAVYGPPMEYGYQPPLYGGSVVYYTGGGVPYYWQGGTRVWLPAPVRPRYVEHWRRYRPAYNGWYQHPGPYYRSYRFTGRDGGPPGFGGRPSGNWQRPPGPPGGLGATPGGPPQGGPNWQHRPGSVGGPGAMPGGQPRGGPNWQHRSGPSDGLGATPDRAARGWSR
jgi:hypothetical protein